MLGIRGLLVLATAAMVASGCGRIQQSADEDQVVDPAAAAKTVVLRVQNLSTYSMELRTILNGRSHFVGSIGGSDSTSILLDPTMFPTGTIYLTATPADGRGRALVGPISVGRGDKIQFTIQPALEMSRALVVR